MTDERPPYYKKYKADINNFIWPTKDVEVLIKSWINQKTIPSILLAGSPGLGKTTIAEIIIDELGISEDDVLRLNGVNDNSVETVRTTIKEFCELGGWSGIRIVFFDEADNLSLAAQGALRIVIDEYANTVKFILTCNYPHRIIDAISSSRLVRIDFQSLNPDDFLGRMISVLDEEEVNVDEKNFSIVNSIYETCYPDMRKALNELQASVIDGKLSAIRKINTSVGVWENYIKEIILKKSDPLGELIHIRNTLSSLSPDEMEEVYKFLYRNGSEFFGDSQIKAIYIINNGQIKHRNALLPDLILLEVILRLLALAHDKK